jgi:hypothetical protein
MRSNCDKTGKKGRTKQDHYTKAEKITLIRKYADMLKNNHRTGQQGFCTWYNNQKSSANPLLPGKRDRKLHRSFMGELVKECVVSILITYLLHFHYLT